jgi:hypothetical protein
MSGESGIEAMRDTLFALYEGHDNVEVAAEMMLVAAHRLSLEENSYMKIQCENVTITLRAEVTEDGN